MLSISYMYKYIILGLSFLSKLLSNKRQMAEPESLNSALKYS